MQRKKIFGIVISIIVLILIGWILSPLFQDPAKNEHAQDLGSELQYIGASVTGCELCPSGKLVSYYFATSLGEEDLQKYFSKTELKDKNTDNGFLELRLKMGEEFFSVYYAPKGSNPLREVDLKKNERPYVMWLSKAVYPIAQRAL